MDAVCPYDQATALQFALVRGRLWEPIVECLMQRGEAIQRCLVHPQRQECKGCAGSGARGSTPLRPPPNHRVWINSGATMDVPGTELSTITVAALHFITPNPIPVRTMLLMGANIDSPGGWPACVQPATDQGSALGLC
jgi:hypothetical protein